MSNGPIPDLEARIRQALHAVCLFEWQGGSSYQRAIEFLRPFVRTDSRVLTTLLDRLLQDLAEHFYDYNWAVLNMLRQELPGHEGLKFLVRYFAFGQRGYRGSVSEDGYCHMETFLPEDAWFRRWIRTFSGGHEAVYAYLSGDHGILRGYLDLDAQELLEKWAATDASLLPTLLSLRQGYRKVFANHPDFPWADYALDFTPPVSEHWDAGWDPTGHLFCPEAPQSALRELFEMGESQTTVVSLNARERIAFFASTVPSAWSWIKEHPEYVRNQSWWDKQVIKACPEPDFLKARIEAILSSPDGGYPVDYMVAVCEKLRAIPSLLPPEETTELWRRFLRFPGLVDLRLHLMTELLRHHPALPGEYDELFALIPLSDKWSSIESAELLLGVPTHRSQMLDFLRETARLDELGLLRSMLGRSAVSADASTLISMGLASENPDTAQAAFGCLLEHFPDSPVLRDEAERIVFENGELWSSAIFFLAGISLHDDNLRRRLVALSAEQPADSSLLVQEVQDCLTDPDFRRAEKLPSLPPERVEEILRFSGHSCFGGRIDWIAIALCCEDERAAMDYFMSLAKKFNEAPENTVEHGSAADVQQILQLRWPGNERVRLHSCAALRHREEGVRISAAQFLSTAYPDHPDTKPLIREQIATTAEFLGLYLGLHEQYADVADEVFGILERLPTEEEFVAFATDIPWLLIRQFGPRKDLLLRLSHLAESSRHPDLCRAILAELERHCPESPRLGLRGRIRAARLDELGEITSEGWSENADSVLQLARTDPEPDVQLAALTLYQKFGDPARFPLEALQTVCRTYPPAIPLLRQLTGNVSLRTVIRAHLYNWWNSD